MGFNFYLLIILDIKQQEYHSSNQKNLIPDFTDLLKCQFLYFLRQQVGKMGRSF